MAVELSEPISIPGAMKMFEKEGFGQWAATRQFLSREISKT